MDSPLIIAGLKGVGPDLNDPPFKTPPNELWRQALLAIEKLVPAGSSSSSPATTDRVMAEITAIALKADLGIFNDGGLELFGKWAYTFINPVFGDQEVMDRIQELYPSDLYVPDQTPVSEDGEGAVHWLLRSKKFPGTFRCSVEGCTIPELECPRRGRGDGEPLQHYGSRGRDLNDTLCQTYTVLGYMEEALKGWKPVVRGRSGSAASTAVPVRLPPRIKVTGNPDRYELQQSMVLAYLMLLSPPENFGEGSTRPVPGVGSLRLFLEERRGIYSDQYNLTQQKGRDGKPIPADGPYPPSAYVTYTRASEEGTRAGIVQKIIKRGGQVASYQVREVEVAVDGRPQRYPSKRRESIPASSVKLSVGHLTGDEFIAFILITLSAWQQWGWRYYKGQGTATNAQNAAALATRAAALALTKPQGRSYLGKKGMLESRRQATGAAAPPRPPVAPTRKRGRESPAPAPARTRSTNRPSSIHYS